MLKIISSKNPSDEIAKATASIINQNLKENINTLWLLAGGSAIDFYRIIPKYLDWKLDFSNLKVSLGDERYDKNPLHETATWPIFRELELFKRLEKRGTTIHNVLEGNAIDIEAGRMNAFVQKSLDNKDFLLLNLGIGADGHTAGIIPLKSDTLFSKIYLEGNYVVSHNKGGQHPNRITISPKLITSANEILSYAVGEEKKKTLEKLIRLDKFYPDRKWSNELHNYPALYLTVKNARIFTK